MSRFIKIFRRKKNEKSLSTSEAIQQLKDTEDLLIKKQEYLEKRIQTELGIASKNGFANRRAALQALKRKKRFEKQLQQIDGTLSTIEMQRDALECANTNTTILQTMKDAADAMKRAHHFMDVDQVHDLMDDIADQQDVAKEISDAISNPISEGNTFDEDELEVELNQLEEEFMSKELSINLPSVPDELITETQHNGSGDEEDNIKLLEQWAL